MSFLFLLCMQSKKILPLSVLPSGICPKWESQLWCYFYVGGIIKDLAGGSHQDG